VERRHPDDIVSPAERNGSVNDWNPIHSAPHDCDLHLGVIEDGEVYALIFPCRRRGSQWADARTGKLLDIDPTHWRAWAD
jgi:hypothetical protein